MLQEVKSRLVKNHNLRLIQSDFSNKPAKFETFMPKKQDKNPHFEQEIAAGILSTVPFYYNKIVTIH